VIRVYDDANNVIETHEHVGKFKGSCGVNRYSQKNLPFNASLARDPKKNYLTLAVGPHASKWVAAPRRKLWCGQRFRLIPGLDQKIININRQVFDVSHILDRRFHVKKYRLIIWIHRVKRLVCGHERIDFRGGLFHLLPVSQDNGCDWTANGANRNAYPDENRDDPAPIAIVLCPPSGPLQSILHIRHRHQPRSWRYYRHAVSSDRAGNQIDCHEWHRNSPGQRARKPLRFIVKF
jgi:hypothetical protein